MGMTSFLNKKNVFLRNISNKHMEVVALRRPTHRFCFSFVADGVVVICLNTTRMRNKAQCAL